jgi:hypothetical protein
LFLARPGSFSSATALRKPRRLPSYSNYVLKQKLCPAAQFNGLVSGRPASACPQAIVRVGPPDTTFLISRHFFLALASWCAMEGEMRKIGKSGLRCKSAPA